MVDQGVNSLRIGYATAVAVILFFICFVFSILYQIFVLRRDIAGGTTQDGRLMSARQPAAPARLAPFSNAPVVRRRARARRGRDRADRVRRAQRLPHHRPARREPGRPAAPVGDAQLHEGDHVRRRSGASSATASIIAAIATVLVVGVSALAAYPLSRFQFRGREAIYTFFTLGLLFPIAVAALPLYLLLRQLAPRRVAARRRAPRGGVRDPDHDHHPAPVHARRARPSSRTRRRSTAARASASSGASCCRSPGPRS